MQIRIAGRLGVLCSHRNQNATSAGGARASASTCHVKVLDVAHERESILWWRVAAGSLLVGLLRVLIFGIGIGYLVALGKIWTHAFILRWFAQTLDYGNA